MGHRQRPGILNRPQDLGKLNQNYLQGLKAAQGAHGGKCEMFSQLCSQAVTMQFSTWFCQRYDVARDNYIDLMELKLMMEKLGAPQTHLGLKTMIKEVDEDLDNKLSFREVSGGTSTYWWFNPFFAPDGCSIGVWVWMTEHRNIVACFV